MCNNCTINKNKYRIKTAEYLESCEKKWTYMELKSSNIYKVLLFSKGGAGHNRKHSSFIIAISQDKDTIGLVDHETEFSTEPGDVIKFEPGNWSLEAKENIFPRFIVYKEEKINKLHCKIKKVYYGRFSRKYF